MTVAPLLLFFLAVEAVSGGILHTGDLLVDSEDPARTFGFGFQNNNWEGLDEGDNIVYELDEAEGMDDLFQEQSPVVRRGHVDHQYQQSHEVRWAHLPA